MHVVLDGHCADLPLPHHWRGNLWILHRTVLAMRFIPLIIVLIVIISLSVAFLNKWLGMINDGYPRNPFKWAQERRWRENASRAVRIMYLEHDLGLHADRDANCIECDKDKQRALDAKWLGNEPFDFPYTPLTDMAKLAYDRSIRFPPRPTAEPGRIKK